MIKYDYRAFSILLLKLDSFLYCGVQCFYDDWFPGNANWLYN